MGSWSYFKEWSIEFKEIIMWHHCRVLCCVELLQGNPSIGRFSLQELDVWYFILNCLFIESIPFWWPNG